MVRHSHSLNAGADRDRYAFVFGDAATARPAEFVDYLLFTHKENGEEAPISREDFSQHVKGRAHYFSEVFSQRVQHPLLPWSLAVSMANLTGTHPYFWQKQSYTRAEAEGMSIDFSKHRRASANDSPHPAHVRPQALTVKALGMLYEKSADTFSPAEFLQYLLDTHKEGEVYAPISRGDFSKKYSRRDHAFTEFFNHEKVNHAMPKKLAQVMARLTNNADISFWRKTSYTLADAEGIVLDMAKDAGVDLAGQDFTFAARAHRLPVARTR